VGYQQLDAVGRLSLDGFGKSSKGLAGDDQETPPKKGRSQAVVQFDLFPGDRQAVLKLARGTFALSNEFGRM